MQQGWVHPMGEPCAPPAPPAACGQSGGRTMLPKGVWGCAVPMCFLLFLLFQDPAQKQAQVDPRWVVFQAEQTGGAVSFQPLPALTPPPPAGRGCAGGRSGGFTQDPALPPAQGTSLLSTPGRKAWCPQPLPKHSSPSHSDLSSNRLDQLPSSLFNGLAELQQL